MLTAPICIRVLPVQIFTLIIATEVVGQGSLCLICALSFYYKRARFDMVILVAFQDKV